MELTEWSWQGYGRKHGAPGIRNRVLVIYTVKCSEFVARRIVEESGHPDVELVGFDGCTDNQYAVDLLISLIKHPNVGAVLTVGLGCEYIQPQWLARKLPGCSYSRRAGRNQRSQKARPGSGKPWSGLSTPRG